MILNIEYSNNFKKDYDKIKKQGKNLANFSKILKILSNNEPIPTKYKDHPLKGELKDYRELHIQPDWLLIYQISGDTLSLIGTGSHSYLFG